MLTIEELRRKDVIAIADGRRIGRTVDVEIDELTGQVKTLIIGVRRPWIGWLQTEERKTVPYHMVQTLGKDVILLDEVLLTK